MAFFSPQDLARSSARHPWKVVAAWLVVLVVSFGLISNLLADGLTTEADITSSPDAKVGQQLLEDRLRGPMKANEAIVIRSTNHTVDDPAFRSFVEGIYGKVGALGPDAIDSRTNFYESGIPSL